MRKTRLPLGFDEVQYVDLIGWRGGRGNIFFKDLVAACRAKIDGMDAPKPKGPLYRTWKRISTGTLSTAGLAALAAFSADIASVQDQVCSVRLAQPGLSDMCGGWGLGNKPTKSEREAYESLEPGNCEALRDYVRRFSKSPLAEEADRLANNPVVTREESWSPVVTPVRLYVSEMDDAFPTEATAREKAEAAAQLSAERACKGFGAATETYRYVAAKPVAQEWDCSEYRNGFSCAFDGEASCELEVKKIMETSVCGAGKQ